MHRAGTNRHLLPGLAMVLGLFAACGGNEPAQPSSVPEIRASVPDNEIPQKIDVEALTFQDKARLFVLPAPSETLAILGESAHAEALQSAMGTELTTYDGLDDWRVALVVGETVADLLITIPSADDAAIVRRIDHLIVGIGRLGVDAEAVGELEHLRAQVSGGGMARDELVTELDDLRSDMLARRDEHPQHVALVAVGGWARAVNLVSQVALAHGEVPKGAEALKLRAVVTTLIDELGTSPDVVPVVTALQRILPVASGVTDAEPPTLDELQTMQSATGEILAMSQI